MERVKNTILLGLIVFFFAGNVGLNIFKHVCSEDGESISYVVNTAGESCDNHHEEENVPPCCKVSHEDDNDCCKDEFQYVKLKFDAEQIFISQIEWLPLKDIQSIYSIDENSEIEDATAFAEYPKPPPLSTSEFLSINQVWII